jgi:hypothetical protein
MPYSLSVSPSGLVHHTQILTNGRGITRCGHEVDWEKWGRISLLDDWMFSKGIQQIREKVEASDPKRTLTCNNCFS